MTQLFPSFSITYHQVLKRPLQSVIVLIWLIGLTKIGLLLAQQPNAVKPLVGLAASIALGLAVIRTHRLYQFIFLPSLSGLAATVLLLRWLGFDASWQLSLCAAAYGFLLTACANRWYDFDPKAPRAAIVTVNALGYGTTLLALMFSFFGTLTDTLGASTINQVPIFILATIQFGQFAQRKQWALPIPVTIFALLFTLVYLTVTGQAHQVSTYAQLNQDQLFLLLVTGLALAVILIQRLHQETTTFLHATACLVAISTYVQQLLLPENILLQAATWLLATLVFIVYYHRKTCSLRRQITLCLAISMDIFLLLAWWLSDLLLAAPVLLTVIALLGLIAALKRTVEQHRFAALTPVLTATTEIILLLAHVLVFIYFATPSAIALLLMSLLAMIWLTYRCLDHAVGRSAVMHAYRLYYYVFLPSLAGLIATFLLFTALDFTAPSSLGLIAITYGFALAWLAERWSNRRPNTSKIPITTISTLGYGISLQTIFICFVVTLGSTAGALIPVMLLATLQFAWLARRAAWALPIPLAIAAALLTLFYLFFTGQLHQLATYANLTQDHLFLLLTTGVAFIVALRQHYRPEQAAFLGISAYIIALLTYGQQLLLPDNFELQMVTWLLATAVFITYYLRATNSLLRQITVCASVSLDIFLLLAWLLPTVIPGIPVMLTVVVLLALIAVLKHTTEQHRLTDLTPTLRATSEIILLLAHALLLYSFDRLSDIAVLAICLLIIDLVVYRWFERYFWRVVASVLFLFVWHTWSFAIGLNMPLGDLLALMMLQTAMLLLVYHVWTFVREKSWRPPRSLLILSVLASIEWVILLANFGEPFANAFAIIITMIGLTDWIMQYIKANRHPQALYVSWLACVVLFSYLYFRVSTLGWSPPALTDITFCLLAAYALAALSSWRMFSGSLSIITLLAIAALFMAPIHPGSIAGTTAMLGVSGLCLWLHASYRKSWLFFTGVLLATASIYFWIPQWFGDAIFLQAYILPVAVMLLMVLQLHQTALTATTQHQLRLAILAVLYSGTTIDLFVNDHFGVFLSALGLGLLGAILGIALRIRAFLYGGVIFLTLNIMGQLFQFYPEQGLEIAYVLIALGTLITLMMFWFSIKRQAILQRVNSLRSSVSTWD